MVNRWGKCGNSDRFYFGRLQNHCISDCSHKIKICMLLGRKAMTNLGSILKSKNIILPTKVHPVKSYGFSSSHIRMWELDHKESWALKNWRFCTVVLEKSLESPLDCKEIKLVSPTGNQSWIFVGRTDAEALILLPPAVKSQLSGKDPDLILGKTGAWGEWVDRGCDGWMASVTQWTWVSASSGSWWWAGKPGMLQSMGSQKVRHRWVTELNSPTFS